MKRATAAPAKATAAHTKGAAGVEVPDVLAAALAEEEREAKLRKK
jgi:hypothetical protein